MNYLDIIICIPLVWGIYRGFTKGLIIQLACIAALILGVICAVWFSRKAEQYAKTWLGWNNEYLPLICFALIFIGAVILVFLLGKLLETAVKIAALGIVNRIAGAVFGMLKYALLISVVFFLIGKMEKSIHLIPEKMKEGSLLYKPVSEVVPVIRKEIGTGLKEGI